jgi:hypothetical protein
MTPPALYAACVEHLTFAATITVECLASEHRAEVAMVSIAAKTPGWFRVLDLRGCSAARIAARRDAPSSTRGGRSGTTSLSNTATARRYRPTSAHLHDPRNASHTV